MDETKNSSYGIPTAIIIAGLVIAGAVYFKGSTTIDNGPVVKADDQTAAAAELAALENLMPVSPTDHLRGQINAPIKIVEFSDLECPFCKTFHQTMNQVMIEYGQSGQVAWIYRHFPLDQLHPKARQEAEATECAAALGGEEKFWALTDKIFEVTPSNNGLDLSTLPELATSIGLDAKEFSDCLNSGQMTEKVETQYQNAIKSGGQGTPFPIIITADGKKIPLRGALPLNLLKQSLDGLLTELEK
ncbi:MAG: thioredoxin domain-containing protein [Patescibacteria group bacterium]